MALMEWLKEYTNAPSIYGVFVTDDNVLAGRWSILFDLVRVPIPTNLLGRCTRDG